MHPRLFTSENTGKCACLFFSQAKPSEWCAAEWSGCYMLCSVEGSVLTLNLDDFLQRPDSIFTRLLVQHGLGQRLHLIRNKWLEGGTWCISPLKHTHVLYAHIHTHLTSMPSKALTQASDASQMALRSCPPSRARTTRPPASDISWRVRKPKPGREQHTNTHILRLSQIMTGQGFVDID